MSRIEGPQVMASIIAIGVIALAVVLLRPESIKDVTGPAVTAIGMLGMKLLEGNEPKV